MRYFNTPPPKHYPVKFSMASVWAVSIRAGGAGGATKRSDKTAPIAHTMDSVGAHDELAEGMRTRPPFARAASESEGIRHLFVLDTSWRATLEDQCVVAARGGGVGGGADGGATGFDDDAPGKRVSRVDCQVAAMKTICCLEEPDAVGVILMGSTEIRVSMDLVPTESWRLGRGDGDKAAVLATYFVNPLKIGCEAPSSSQDEITCTRPERLPVALQLSVKKLKELKECDLDLFDKESAGRVTVFLCAPPCGMAGVAERLGELKEELDAINTEVTLILLPDAYSARHHKVEDENGLAIWEAMSTHTLYVAPQVTCSDEDMGVLEALCGERFDWQIHMPDFLSTLLEYRQHYFGEDFQVWETLLPRWEACYGRGTAPLLLPLGAEPTDAIGGPKVTCLVKVHLKPKDVCAKLFEEYSLRRTVESDDPETIFALAEDEMLLMFIDVNHQLFERRMDALKKEFAPVIDSLHVYRLGLIPGKGERGERKGEEWDAVQVRRGFDPNSPEPECPCIIFRVFLWEGVDVDEWMKLYEDYDAERKLWCDDSKTVVAKVSDKEVCVCLSDVNVDIMNQLFQDNYDHVNAVCNAHLTYQFSKEATFTMPMGT